MKSRAITRVPVEIMRLGFDALCDRLGVAGALRFILHYDSGRGNYTKEREKILSELDIQHVTEMLRRVAK